jgi:pimeloyl-ACP methyl ester carboxylesterase
MDHMARCSVRAHEGFWSWKFDENVTRLFQQRGNDPTGIDDVAELADMRTPVDFIYGEESRVVTPERAARLATCLPDVRSVTGIPAGHHHLPVSQPIALVAALRALLGASRS